MDKRRKDKQYNLQNRKSRKTDNTMDKRTKGKTTIYKTVSQEGQTIQWTKDERKNNNLQKVKKDRQYNGQKDERKNNNLQNRKSRKTDNTMDKRRKEKQTIYKTVSQERQTIQWTKDERKNNNLQNRKSRRTDNTMDKRTKGKTTIYKTVSQEGQTIQWTKGRKEKQQSTKP